MKTERRSTHWAPWLALAVVLVASMACGGSANPTLVATSLPPEMDQQVQPTSAPAPIAQQNYKIGDIVQIGDHVLVVLGWENVPGDEFSKPDAGKKFVAVELLVVNNSNSPMSLSTMLQMTLKDSTAQAYSVDFMASTAIDSGNLDGELAPGEKIRGKVGFQIPESAQGLQFVFDASIFGTGKLFVDLGPEPLKVEPPASIAGETAQQTYKVGDVIQMGTTLLTVNQVSNPPGDQFNQPAAGNKFIVIDMTIENHSEAAISFSTIMQTWLKDQNGQKYDVDLMASVASGGNSPDGEIAANEALRGQIGFQVPVTATGLVFVFDADAWGTGKAFVALP